MKKSDLYYLSRPDEMSLHGPIARGHGFFWVRVTGWRYRSVATGMECMFWSSELTPLEQTDETLVR